MIDLHQRVRLAEFETVPREGGSLGARVGLSWDGDLVHHGEAESDESPHGQLRAAAEATARALVLATQERVALEVLAVKAIDAFDTIIVVVSLSSRVGTFTERLVGACLIRGREPARGAVLAVLDATNRLLTKLMTGTLT